MGQKWFAVIFAVAALIAMLILMPGVQSNAIAGAVENAFGLETWITGLIIVVLLGAIIIGGVKSIANAAQIIVPFMALAYIIMAIIIIVMNISEVPTVFALIFSSAFGAQEILGALLVLPLLGVLNVEFIPMKLVKERVLTLQQLRKYRILLSKELFKRLLCILIHY